MSVLEAIILGIVQGATEFLPISSSGHLLLIPSLFDLQEPNLNGIAIAHLGTLLAIQVYFRTDLWMILRAVLAGLGKRKLLGTFEARLGWYIAIGTIPAIVFGFLLNNLIDELIESPIVAASLLIVTGIILIIGEQLVTGDKEFSQMTWSDAITIGFAQVLALLPGISRSGVTISTGLGRHLDRPTAARYSFLLGVPAIAGAGLLAMVDISQSSIQADQIMQLFITFLVAAIVGYVCIRFLMNWLQRRNLYLFAAYCISFGSLYLLISWLR